MVPTMRRASDKGDVGEIDGDALGGVVGIEEDVEAGGLADGLIDDLDVFDHVQGDGIVRDGLELDGPGDAGRCWLRTSALAGHLLHVGVAERRAAASAGVRSRSPAGRPGWRDRSGGAGELGEGAGESPLWRRTRPRSTCWAAALEAHALEVGRIAEVFRLPGWA